MKIVEFLKNSICTVCAKYLNENNEIEYLPIFYIAGSQTLPPPLPPEEEKKRKIRMSKRLTFLFVILDFTMLGIIIFEVLQFL